MDINIGLAAAASGDFEKSPAQAAALWQNVETIILKVTT
jgi:hypothetical protein